MSDSKQAWLEWILNGRKGPRPGAPGGQPMADPVGESYVPGPRDLVPLGERGLAPMGPRDLEVMGPRQVGFPVAAAGGSPWLAMLGGAGAAGAAGAYMSQNPDSALNQAAQAGPQDVSVGYDQAPPVLGPSGAQAPTGARAGQMADPVTDTPDGPVGPQIADYVLAARRAQAAMAQKPGVEHKTPQTAAQKNGAVMPSINSIEDLKVRARELERDAIKRDMEHVPTDAELEALRKKVRGAQTVDQRMQERNQIKKGMR